MFTEKHGTNIINEHRKKIKKRKNAKNEFEKDFAS